MNENHPDGFRILVADDESDILDIYTKVMELSTAKKGGTNRLERLEAKLFGTENQPKSRDKFELTTCLSGEDAVEQVRLAVNDKRPFALAFLDIRMPPGRDGIWAAEQIRKLDRNINIVIVSGYADYETDEIVDRVPPRENLLYMQKPFYPHEIQHFAYSLCAKYQVECNLQRAHKLMESLVERRTVELKRTNEQLKGEIAERIKIETDLRKARDRAEAGDQAKSLFLANMGHEFRTPLNGVIGMADLLRDTILDARQLEYVNIITDSSKNLLAIITDILDYSRIESGDIDLDHNPLSIPACVDDVVGATFAGASQKNIEIAAYLSPTVSPFLFGDAFRIRQILLNFVRNAIKFSEQGEIIISAENLQPDSMRATITFEIADSGIGIDKSKVADIFKPFTQVDSSSTRQFGGAGLGLAINHRLIELMGGDVGIKESEHGGSIFWFTLNLPKDDQILDRNYQRNLGERRCLIVSERGIVAATYARQLESWSGICQTASTIDEAIEYVSTAKEKSNPFELIVVISGLSGGVGPNDFERFDHHHLTAALPRIVLVNQITAEQEEHSNSTALVDYLEKPVKEFQLYQAINKLFE